MLVCRICGWENPVTAAFCTNCGSGLARGRAADGDPNMRFKAMSSPPPSAPAVALEPADDVGATDADEDVPAMPKLTAPDEPRRESAPTILDFRVPAQMMAEEAFGAGDDAHDVDETVHGDADEAPGTDDASGPGTDPEPVSRADLAGDADADAHVEDEADDAEAEAGPDDDDEAARGDDDAEAGAADDAAADDDVDASDGGSEDEAGAHPGDSEEAAGSDDMAASEDAADGEDAADSEDAADGEGAADADAEAGSGADEDDVPAAADDSTPDGDPARTDPEVPVAASAVKSAAPVDLGAVARALREEAGMSVPPGDLVAGEVHAEEVHAEEDEHVRGLLTPPTPISAELETIDVDPIDDSADGFDDLRSADEGDELVDAIDALSVGDDDDLEGEGEVPELSTSDLQSVGVDEADGEAMLDTGELEALSVDEVAEGARRVPPPIPEVTAQFVLRPLSENLSRSRLVPIGEEPVTVGRAGADVEFAGDDYLSPMHARFSVDDHELYVDDLHSLNGVWLRIRDEAIVRPGDSVLFGRQVLRVDALAPRPNGTGSDDGTRRIGTVADGVRFCLVQIADDGHPLDVYHLGADGCRIGRHIADLVFTEDNFMSGTHALIRPTEAGLQVRDLSSRNGSWVRVGGRQRLEPGDAVMLGRTVWRISASVD